MKKIYLTKRQFLTNKFWKNKNYRTIMSEKKALRKMNVIFDAELTGKISTMSGYGFILKFKSL